MKSKFYQGIQFKFFSIIILSVISSAISIVLFQLTIRSLFRISDKTLSLLEEQYALIYFVAFLILILLFYYVYSRKIIKRIGAIYNDVALISEGDLTVQIKDSNPDEIGKLAQRINQMVESLKGAQEREAKIENEKNEIISNISHDLKTPLTSLLGYIELIKMNLNQDEKACYGYIEISERKCKDLKKQINDLLEYCSIQFGGIKWTMKRICISDLVDQVMVDFVPEIEKLGMTFHIERELNKKYITGDIDLLVRLLQNIISNSIFYGQDGKSITIKMWSEDSQTMLKIANYGQEIPKEDVPYIFERFYRSEKSRNENTGGKGMGLAIAKSIIDLHAGSIKVSSSREETAFIIAIPEWSSNK